MDGSGMSTNSTYSSATESSTQTNDEGGFDPGWLGLLGLAGLAGLMKKRDQHTTHVTTNNPNAPRR
jgi:MYXO-CTERM domain-containing protein